MNIAREVRDYLKNRPYMLEGLEKNIANLSKLSRLIQKELRIKNIHAIKAALRRHSDKLRKVKQKREEQVLNIMKGSGIKILDNIALVILDKEINVKSEAEIKMYPYTMLLIDKKLIDEISRKYKSRIVKMHKNCTALILNTPEEIQQVPGVVAFETSVLAEQNINVLEFFSCFSYTIIVVDRADALRSYEVLSKLIG